MARKETIFPYYLPQPDKNLLSWVARRLKRQRGSRTVAQVAEAAKIEINRIESLEKGDFHLTSGQFGNTVERGYNLNLFDLLAVLWLRYLARQTRGLAGLDRALTASGENGGPFGVLRELADEGAVWTQSSVARAMRFAPESFKFEFLHNLLSRLPNDWELGTIIDKLTEEFPELSDEIHGRVDELMPLGAYKLDEKEIPQLRLRTIIPMRQICWYAIREINRGLSYLRAQKEDDVNGIIRLCNDSHNGDRALSDPGKKLMAGRFPLTEWGKTYPVEAFMRSVPQIDKLIDNFRADFEVRHGLFSVAARISGAGLGGLIIVHTKAQLHDAAVEWWQSRGHQSYEIIPSEGARVIPIYS